MDGMSILRSLLALAFVAGLVVALGWALRRWDFAKMAGKMQQGRRLKLLETLHLDPRRKAVLLSCDDQNYMVILGAQGEQVIQLSVASHQSSAPIERGETS